MAGKTTTEPKNNLRAWRVFRGLSQAELGERVDTTANVISQLESGVRGLSHKWLLRLAPALGTTPGFLLDHDPNDLDSAWTEAVESVPVDRRDEAIQILRVLTTPRRA